MSEFKDGVLLWWSRKACCGVLIETLTQERFFVHQSCIVVGPAIPTIDSQVRFEVNPRPPLPGKLRAAINIVVLPVSAAEKEPKAAL